MVKLRIVCPFSSSNKSTRNHAPPLRRSSSLTNQNGSNLARYFSIAFFIFAATTYLVFSLDMLMVTEEDDTSASSVTLMPQRRRMSTEDPNESIFNLREVPDVMNKPDGKLPGLIVMEEDEEEVLLEQQQRQNGGNNGRRGVPAYTPPETSNDDEFADGLNSVGLAMQSLGGNSGENDIGGASSNGISSASSTSGGGSSSNSASSEAGDGEDVDDPPQPFEEEEDDDILSGRTSTSKPTNLIGVQVVGPAAAGSGASIASDSYAAATTTLGEWRRMHTCKYGRSEKSPTLAYGTWIWRHRKGAIMHDEYTKTPSDYKLRHLKSALALLSDRTLDVKNVISAAAEAGYTLCKIDLETSIVVAWQPRIRGDALFFTRHALVKVDSVPSQVINPVVIEVPHALYDHTLHQGLHVFMETRAKALILSESHRCSRSLTNKCTGNDGEPIRNLCTTSSKSSASTVYHNSDAAHAVQTTFHAVHEQLAEDNPHALFVSLHAAKSEEFVVSDGTSNLVSPSDPVMLFSQQLAKNLASTKVNLCNEYPSLSREGLPNLISVTDDKRHICGATNVQGRHLNGATDPCRAKIHRNGQELKASGRFLHIEQPVGLVMPIDSKSTKPVMSKPLSESIISALEAVIPRANSAIVAGKEELVDQ